MAAAARRKSMAKKKKKKPFPRGRSNIRRVRLNVETHGNRTTQSPANYALPSFRLYGDILYCTGTYIPTSKSIHFRRNRLPIL